MPGRALLIGCGNIGALYDLDRSDDDVRTHAKAYRARGVGFDVLDSDPARAGKVAERYGGRAYRDLDEVDLSAYQAVSLCSSTGTHAAYLERLLRANVPLVFCEKPVASSVRDLERLPGLRADSRSLVLVNYMRRFLPPYRRLRDRLRAAGGAQRLASVVVRYQRGFLNNAGHALDLLEFLFDAPVTLDGFAVLRSEADAFSDDPTLTASFEYAGSPVMLLGFPGTNYPMFEIELNLADRRIHILDMGDRIVHAGPALEEGRRLKVDESLDEAQCLRSYMLPVFDAGYRWLEDGARGATNFDSAAALNLRMVRAARPAER